MTPPRINRHSPQATADPAARVVLPPTDVLQNIMKRLDARDAYHAAQAHPDFYRAAKDPAVWSSIAAHGEKSPVVHDPKVVSDLCSSGITQAIHMGAKIGSFAGETALLLIPGLLTLGTVFNTVGDSKRERKKMKAESEKIRLQARNDELQLFTRLKQLGIPNDSLPPSLLPKQVASLRLAQQQRQHLEKALNQQLLRHDWGRTFKIVELLGADAPLSLTSTQLKTVAEKALLHRETEIARWLVGRGATISPGLVNRLAQAQFLRIRHLNHLAALGATIPRPRDYRRENPFSSLNLPTQKDLVFNQSLAGPAIDVRILENTAEWPQHIIEKISPALRRVQNNDTAALVQLGNIALREALTLVRDQWATGDDLQSRRAEVAIYQEALRRTLQLAKAQKLHLAAPQAASTEDLTTSDAAAATHIQGKFLPAEAEDFPFRHAEDALIEIEGVASTLTAMALFAPLRETDIREGHEEADSGAWQALRASLAAGLPADVRDRGGVTLANKVQERFNDLVGANQGEKALAMRELLPEMTLAAPVQMHLDRHMWEAIEARDWATCQHWVRLGGDLNLQSFGDGATAGDHISAAMAEAIAGRSVENLEKLLNIMLPPPHLPWMTIAKEAFAGGPGSFEPAVLQAYLKEKLTQASFAGSWDEVHQFALAGVPVSRDARRALDRAALTAAARGDEALLATTKSLMVILARSGR